MNTNLKTSILIILTLLLSFSIHCNEKIIIAENHEKSIQITESQLKLWVKRSKNSQYYDKKTQIEDFFIEKSILSKRSQLPHIINEKIDFYHQLEQYNLAKKRVMKKLGDHLDINPDAIKKEVMNLKMKQTSKSDKVRLYQIYKRYPLNATEADKRDIMDKMIQIRGEITSLEDLKRLAIAESNAQSRLKKGLIGNVHKGQFDPKIDAIVMKMQKNELSEIINLPTGLVLFYCENIVPAKIKTKKEIEKIARKKTKNQLLASTWGKQQDYYKKQNPIKINWDLINNGSETDSKPVITSKTSKLSHQNLLWLLNNYNSNRPISQFNQSKIETTIHEYFHNQQLYNQLELSDQQSINEALRQQYKELIFSEVVIQLIKPKIKQPTKEQMKQYYLENKDDFYTPKKYNLSAIAIDFDKKNRAKQYQKMQLILDKIEKKETTFNSAKQQFSIIKKRFPKMELDSIAKKRMNTIFGIRIAQFITQMEPNKISDIFETKSGYIWIVKLNNVQQTKVIPFEDNEAKDFIHNKIMSDQIEQLQLDLFDNIIKDLNIKIKL